MTSCPPGTDDGALVSSLEAKAGYPVDRPVREGGEPRGLAVWRGGATQWESCCPRRICDDRHCLERRWWLGWTDVMEGAQYDEHTSGVAESGYGGGRSNGE
jgi:hypothetical protein